MGLKSTRVILYFLGSLFLIYLIVDLVHFFQFRINVEVDYSKETSYESIPISIVKWFLIIISIISIYLIRENYRLGLHLIINCGLLILLSFFLKGQYQTLLDGHLLFLTLTLELTALFAVVFALYIGFKKYSITASQLMLDLIIIAGFYFIFIDELPIV